MKKNLQVSFLIVLLSFLSTTISFAQCGDDNSWSGGYITPDTVGSTKTLAYTTGQYALAYVTPGANYTVSTCGSSSFDSQLIIYDMSGNLLAYNDDYCGLQSTVNFVATSCGYVKVEVDQY